MPKGWSLYKLEDRWHEREFAEAELTAQKLTVDIEAEEGDRVSILAHSVDGHHYRGDYRYREGSCSNGEVVFERYSGPSGECFVGTRQEAGGPATPWILTVLSA